MGDCAVGRVVSARRAARIRTKFIVAAGAALLASVPATASETIVYSYDARGRLVKVERSGTINNDVSSCYAYDKADNRSNVTVATSEVCASGGPVTFSISSDGAVTEGANSVFTITKSGTSASSLSVNYATANGTATAGSDYTAKSGTLTFTSLQWEKAVSVATTDDTTVENSENFTMSLSSPTGGALIGTGTATATINDNDSTPACSGVSFTIVSNGAVAEGANSVFTVTKSGSTSSSCTIGYATANITAVAGSDYTSKSGTLTFTALQSSKTVSVSTTDDTVVESAETFRMTLSNPGSGGSVGTPGNATATINDNDTVSGTCNSVSFAIGDADTVEGFALHFVVARTGSASINCSVNFATANGTATAGSDYYAASGPLTFAPADTSKTIIINTIANAPLEPVETMFVNLSGATNGASISDAQGVGEIYDQSTGLMSGPEEGDTSGSSDSSDGQ